MVHKILKETNSQNYFRVKKVLPSCNVCGVSVIDLVEPEVAKEGQVKEGKYVNNVWTCNECLNKRL
ncbi:MAG: hypothetical protein H0X50_03090 [Nitrosopumilus sp.]|nr:hypothetical protein [Nitrosopumilus sp.]